jgi:hypothetical protein
MIFFFSAVSFIIYKKNEFGLEKVIKIEMKFKQKSDVSDLFEDIKYSIGLLNDKKNF